MIAENKHENLLLDDTQVTILNLFGIFYNFNYQHIYLTFNLLTYL